jgi:hypothetical protein
VAFRHLPSIPRPPREPSGRACRSRAIDPLARCHDDGGLRHAWHRPYPNTEAQRYEQAIVRFQNDLAGSKPPGFIGATSFKIEAVPWLSDLPGYEDWYLTRLPYLATFRRPTTA